MSCVEIKTTATSQMPRLLFGKEMSTRFYSVQCSALFLPNSNVIVISGDQQLDQFLLMQIGRQEIVVFDGLQDTCKMMLFQNTHQNVETFFWGSFY